MSSGFVTESEAAEARQRRQEEWERVRRPEDPLERPEEPYDSRSLFERLKEQKAKKDMEYEEAHKLKNLIRGLEDDEVQFLELVDKQRMNAERQQLRDEEKELNEFRDRVEKLHEESIDKKLQAELKTNITKPTQGSQKATQKSLLGQGIKRKNGELPTSSNTPKMEKPSDEKKDVMVPKPITINTTQYDHGSLKCIAILPGIGSYTESSDSEVSTDSDENTFNPCKRFDLCGRKVQKKKH